MAPHDLRAPPRRVAGPFHALRHIDLPRRQHEVVPQGDLRLGRTQLARELVIAAHGPQTLDAPPRVVDLALVDAGGDDRPRVGRLPALVRPVSRRCPVRELQRQLAAKRDLLPELPRRLHLRARLHHRVAPPAGRDRRGEDVRRPGPDVERLRDVVGVHVPALAVLGESRLEEVGADAPSVHKRLKHALRRDGPPRARNPLHVREPLLKDCHRARRSSYGRRDELRRTRRPRRLDSETIRENEPARGGRNDRERGAGCEIERADLLPQAHGVALVDGHTHGLAARRDVERGGRPRFRPPEVRHLEMEVVAPRRLDR